MLIRKAPELGRPNDEGREVREWNRDDGRLRTKKAKGKIMKPVAVFSETMPPSRVRSAALRIQFSPDLRDVAPSEMRNLGISRDPNMSSCGLIASYKSGGLGKKREKKKKKTFSLPSSNTESLMGVITDQNGTGTSEIQRDFPNWVGLRENYVSQLEAIAARAILHSPTDDLAMTGAPADAVARTVAADRTQFLLLLCAIRKVTCRIVQSYQYLKRSSASEVQSIGFERFQKIKRHVLRASSFAGSGLGWLNENPFKRWARMELGENPLCSTHDIHGRITVLGMQSSVLYSQDRSLLSPNECLFSAELVDYLPKELRFTANEFELLKELGQEMREVQQGWSEEVQERELQRHREERELHRLRTMKDANLNFLLFDHPDKSRLEKDFYASHSFHKFRSTVYWFNMWRRTYKIELQVKDLLLARVHKNKRLVMNAFLRHKWQCAKFRDMQQTYNQRLLYSTFDAYREYLIWCRRFNSILFRSNHHIMRLYLQRLHWIGAHVFANRRFIHNVRHRRKQTSFRCLRNNVTLQKFYLMKRLKNKSQISFCARHAREWCFIRWKERCRVAFQIDVLDGKIEDRRLREAVQRWREAARVLFEEERAARKLMRDASRSQKYEAAIVAAAREEDEQWRRRQERDQDREKERERTRRKRNQDNIGEGGAGTDGQDGENLDQDEQADIINNMNDDLDGSARAASSPIARGYSPFSRRRLSAARSRATAMATAVSSSVSQSMSQLQTRFGSPLRERMKQTAKSLTVSRQISLSRSPLRSLSPTTATAPDTGVSTDLHTTGIGVSDPSPSISPVDSPLSGPLTRPAPERGDKSPATAAAGVPRKPNDALDTHFADVSAPESPNLQIFVSRTMEDNPHMLYDALGAVELGQQSEDASSTIARGSASVVQLSSSAHQDDGVLEDGARSDRKKEAGLERETADANGSCVEGLASIGASESLVVGSLPPIPSLSFVSSVSSTSLTHSAPLSVPAVSPDGTSSAFIDHAISPQQPPSHASRALYPLRFQQRDAPSGYSASADTFDSPKAAYSVSPDIPSEDNIDDNTDVYADAAQAQARSEASPIKTGRNTHTVHTAPSSSLRVPAGSDPGDQSSPDLRDGTKEAGDAEKAALSADEQGGCATQQSDGTLFGKNRGDKNKRTKSAAQQRSSSPLLRASFRVRERLSSLVAGHESK